VPRIDAMTTSDASGPPRVLLSARESANAVSLSIAAFWRGVKAKRLPAPVYPAARSPRWFLDELIAAIELTRALPSDAMAARRRAKRPSSQPPRQCRQPAAPISAAPLTAEAASRANEGELQSNVER
jgi:predicted DNA-binding transcriptional regulator AlpA